MSVEQWIGAILQVLATAAAVMAGLWLKLTTIITDLRVLAEKVQQIENRLDDGGDGVPVKCSVHEQRLDDHDRRLEAVDKA